MCAVALVKQNSPWSEAQIDRWMGARAYLCVCVCAFYFWAANGQVGGPVLTTPVYLLPLLYLLVSFPSLCMSVHCRPWENASIRVRMHLAIVARTGSGAAVRILLGVEHHSGGPKLHNGLCVSECECELWKFPRRCGCIAFLTDRQSAQDTCILRTYSIGSDLCQPQGRKKQHNRYRGGESRSAF